jgi:hypothetical protein
MNDPASKYIDVVFFGWAIFLCFAAVLLAPVDPHTQPTARTYCIIFTAASLLMIYTTIIIPAHLYGSWNKLPTVPNKVAYGFWMSVESLVLLAVEAGASYLFVGMFFKREFW